MNWLEVAIAAGAKDPEEADTLLWGGTCFPFGPPRLVWYQLRHVIRHGVCFDDAFAECGPPRKRFPRRRKKE